MSYTDEEIGTNTDSFRAGQLNALLQLSKLGGSGYIAFDRTCGHWYHHFLRSIKAEGHGVESLLDYLESMENG